jgi:Raf kinase inhibitor-like YbhB/YbcL family protein
MRQLCLWVAAGVVLGGVPARAAETLSVQIGGLTKAGYLPVSAAFCMPKGATAKPEDKSPALRWSAGTAGTKSYVVMMVDPDVVKNLSLMNKPGVTIPANAPRMNIYHWTLTDISPSVTALPAGADGDGFSRGGKPVGKTAYGVRGTNDYWYLFNRNPKMPKTMAGPYGGYDGPCPPGNDLLVHDYRFEVYALDVATLGLSGQFFAPAAMKAMQGHVLAEGTASAKFTFTGD